MRISWLLPCLLLAACSSSETAPQAGAPTTQASATAASATAAPAPVQAPRPPRTGKLTTALHLPAQPAPKYQTVPPPRTTAPLGARPAAGTPGVSTATGRSAPAGGPNTAALFGVGRTAPATTGVAVATALPPSLAAAQEKAIAAMRTKSAAAPAPQAVAFADCTKRLQGAVQGNAAFKLVQNDATGYVVETTTNRGTQRVTCDPRTNTVSFTTR